jgi:hypothetical protein
MQLTEKNKSGFSMNIEKQLAAEHSKKNAQLIVDYIGDDPFLFKELIDVFAKGDIRLTQRGSWPLSLIAEAYPALVKKHIGFLIQLLDKPLHVAVKRNVLRLFQTVDIPKKEMGPLADKCFTYLQSRSEPIAVKAFAMTVLYKICLKEPDLKNELIPILEDMLPFSSSGILSRLNKTLKQLKKL